MVETDNNVVTNDIYNTFILVKWNNTFIRITMLTVIVTKIENRWS